MPPSSSISTPPGSLPQPSRTTKKGPSRQVTPRPGRPVQLNQRIQLNQRVQLNAGGLMRGWRMGPAYQTASWSDCCVKDACARCCSTAATRSTSGRTRRLVTERQYRALMVRHHGHCAVPGCANTKKLDGHHVIHWIYGGRTDLANLILLCEPHHLAHHDGEFTITASGKGRFTFIRKNGTPMMPPPSDADHADAAAQLRERHAAVAPTAATSNWDGQRLDPDYAISVLAHRREFARRRASAQQCP